MAEEAPPVTPAGLPALPWGASQRRDNRFTFQPHPIPCPFALSVGTTGGRPKEGSLVLEARVQGLVVQGPLSQARL